MALTELATASGIPKSTASRLLSALERHGLVEQDGERGRLRPGPAILRVAERGLLERNLVELAGPSLEALSQASGETINLAVPGAARASSTSPRSTAATSSAPASGSGRSVDFHCTAIGKVFLAFGRATIADRAAGRSPRTITDPGLAPSWSASAREDFAVAVDELEAGLAAIAAPVRGAGGEVVAALSISGPTLRMTPDADRRAEPILIEEARS